MGVYNHISQVELRYTTRSRSSCDGLLERFAFFYDPAKQHEVRPLAASDVDAALLVLTTLINLTGVHGRRVDEHADRGGWGGEARHGLRRLHRGRGAGGA